MANKKRTVDVGMVAVWAKRCYFTGRAVADAVLRPHGLGTSQYYVLYHLAGNGPTQQRELVKLLQVERATLSIIVGALVRKGIVEQLLDEGDQRQKTLQLTAVGRKLWDSLPDLDFIRTAAFGDLDADDVATAIEVLRIATGRLEKLMEKEANR